MSGGVMSEAPNAGPSPSSDGLITVSQAAKLLMITEVWVRELAKKGYFTIPERGKVSLVAVVQGYVRSLKDEERRSSKSASASRVQIARAREIELRTAERERFVMRTDEALAVLDEIIGGLASEASGIPARITSDIELRDKIETALHDLFTRASDRLDERASALRAGSETDTPEPEDDA
jgi:hypothetical protein